MKFYAILSWFDEPPTWLSATVASLSKIGVDHLIAVDGSYLHFDGEARSPLEQVEAISMSAEAIGIGCTIIRPSEKMWTERDKRDFCFKVFAQHAEPFVDWCIIVDADDLIVEGSPRFKQELANTDLHVASCRLAQTIDPFDSGGLHNTAQTQNIYQNLPSPTRFKSVQSRCWRLLDNLRVTQTHYSYYGEDASGITLNLRGDISSSVELNAVKADIFSSDSPPVIEHRDPWRVKHRKVLKKAYYELRDELGLERA